MKSYDGRTVPPYATYGPSPDVSWDEYFRPKKDATLPHTGHIKVIFTAEGEPSGGLPASPRRYLKILQELGWKTEVQWAAVEMPATYHSSENEEKGYSPGDINQEAYVATNYWIGARNGARTLVLWWQKRKNRTTFHNAIIESTRVTSTIKELDFYLELVKEQS